jgi:pyridoxal phosphate enzyme (YggS family)
VTGQRRGEIAAGLHRTRARIDAACAEADRSPDEVTLVVVTKTFPASDVAHLAALGVRDVAENRHPEAARKAEACAGLGLRWHYVGQLQTNKAKAVAGYADVVHSVDRLKLVRALASGRSSVTAPDPLDCLLQVSLDPPDASGGRGGAPLQDVPALAAEVTRHPELRLRGLMAVAPLGEDPDPAFARLADAASRLRRDWPEATWLSAGMSGDLESAVRHGATHVRVGSAILGTRPPAG